MSFALVLSATPKHPFRQTTPPCSRAPAANAEMQSNRHEFNPLGARSAPVLEVLQAEMMCLSSYNAYQLTTIGHEAMDSDKSHRLRCCTKGSRSHQSKSPVAQYQLDVMLACDAGFHDLNYQVKKHENWHL